MTPAESSQSLTARHCEWAAWALSALALGLALHVSLLPALLAGLFAFQCVQHTSRLLNQRVATPRTRWLILAVVASAVVTGITLGLLALVAFFRSDAGDLHNLLSRMAQTIENMRQTLPPWIADKLPTSSSDLQTALVEWLREHATHLQTWGKEAGIHVARVLIGLVIGAMIAVGSPAEIEHSAPLRTALLARAAYLSEAFRRVVFSQVRISALNTVLTALYLAIALPLAGVQLPLVKTMIAITFIVGLLPVIGNLMSNAVIVTVSLAHSFPVMLASLSFLVVVHKLEYFLNARIVGGQIHARAWELLSAMIVMEAVFGLPGLVVAPIAYAWLKAELSAVGMI